MKRVLLLGGSGFVGRHVCEKLARLNWPMTVLTRRAANASAVQHLPGLTVIEADVHDEAALRRLLPGHDAVVNLVAILHGTEKSFDQVHAALPTALTRACLASGVQRVVHVGALGASESAPSRYLRSKARGEAALHAGVALGLQLSVLRPSVIFGADDRFLNLFAALQRVFPFMPLACAQALFQPVWVEDVAQAVVTCLRDPATRGQPYELCGPTVYTLKDLVQLAGRAAGIRHGRGRPVVGLPSVLGRLQALLMELAPGQPMMSRDNLDSMRVDNVASGRLPGLEALGIAPGALAAIAPDYLAQRDPCVEWRSQ